MRLARTSSLLLCSLLLLYACNKEQAPQPVSGSVKLFATLSFGETKAMVWNDSQILWGAGEKLWFWYDDGRDSFVESSEESSSEGESLAVFEVRIDAAAAAIYRMGAVSPVSAADGKPSDPGQVRLRLPAEQYPAAHSLDPAAFLLLSEPVTVREFPDPIRMEMHPVVALNRLTIKGMPQKIQAVSLTAPAGVALAGVRAFDMREGVAAPLSGGSSSLELRYPTPLQTGDVDIWFASWEVDAQDIQVCVTGSSKYYRTTLSAVSLREGRINTLVMDSAAAEESFIDPFNVPDADILELVRTDVVNTAFYKDVFLDGGCHLNPGIKVDGAIQNGMLPPVLEYLKLTSEYFLSTEDDAFAPYTEQDYELQRSIIAGSEQDINGVLLYPDGEPRFRMVFIFGGSSPNHGKSLGYSGRSRVQTFYANGGCYVGSCAGAYLAGRFADGNARDYFDIWDGGNMIHTGLSNSTTGMKIVSGSPLLRYYDFGGDHYVEGVRHNGGGYMDTEKAPAGTEILARFGTSPKGTTHSIYYDKPSTWAYKRTARTGRLVVCGSHPEDAWDGEVRDFLASMYRYALDGQGIARVKGVLHNGETRAMNRTETGQAAYSPIGDLQCHHFVIYLPQKAAELTVNLEAPSAYAMQLFLKKGSFAFPDNQPDYASDSGSISVSDLEPGLYYVTVHCATTVNASRVITNPATDKGYHFIYSGATGVLNGVSYNLTASWQ